MHNAVQPTEPAITADTRRRPLQFRLLHLLVAILVVSIGLAIYVPIARRQAQRAYTKNRLLHITLALHAYHDAHLVFPPAFQCDAAGQPCHSWRAAISPFMDSGVEARVVDYDFSQAWNSSGNQQAAQQGPNYFRGPRANPSSMMTSYVAVVGPGTMWPGENPWSIGKITDGTHYTIMIVEVENSDIHWMEPRDLPIEELDAWLDPAHQPHLGWQVTGGFVAFADGRIEFLPRDVTKAQIRAMLSPAGGGDWKDLPAYINP